MTICGFKKDMDTICCYQCASALTLNPFKQTGPLDLRLSAGIVRFFKLFLRVFGNSCYLFILLSKLGLGESFRFGLKG